MDIDQHVFISYAHIDNLPLAPQQQGWVTRFHATLETLLSMRIGAKVRIWRDDKLRGNDVFDREILAQFGHTALLVSVLTPRYLASEWCTLELREFCERAEAGGGVALHNKSRVFKVVKAPLDNDAPLPDAVRALLGYEFYVIEDGVPLELDAAYGESFAQNYNRRVGKLAWDAAQLLKELATKPPPLPESASTVYLAECSHDRHDLREQLETELKLLGHSVVPDQRLPLEDEAACLRLVNGWLACSRMSIHLIGAAPGAVPDGERGQAIVALQNQLAAERCRSAGLPRLIWLPEGTQSKLPAQQAFIDALHTDAEAQFGADLLTGGIEDFRNAIHATLERLAKAAAPPTPPTPPDLPASSAPSTPTAPRSIYLICVQQDRQFNVQLRQFLRDAGIDVETPAFEGDAAAVREANRKLLAGCDAVLVYYGAGDEAWKRSVDSELRKLKGLAERAAPAREYTYLAAPRSPDKDDLIAMREPGLIDGLDAFPQAALNALLEALRGAGGAAA